MSFKKIKLCVFGVKYKICLCRLHISLFELMCSSRKSYKVNKSDYDSHNTIIFGKNNSTLTCSEVMSLSFPPKYKYIFKTVYIVSYSNHFFKTNNVFFFCLYICSHILLKFLILHV